MHTVSAHAPGSVDRDLLGMFWASVGPLGDAPLWLWGQISVTAHRGLVTTSVSETKPHACHLCPRTSCSLELRAPENKDGRASPWGRRGEPRAYEPLCHYPLSTQTVKSKDSILKSQLSSIVHVQKGRHSHKPENTEHRAEMVMWTAPGRGGSPSGHRCPGTAHGADRHSLTPQQDATPPALPRWSPSCCVSPDLCWAHFQSAAP